jgi:hypothetical protein
MQKQGALLEEFTQQILPSRDAHSPGFEEEYEVHQNLETIIDNKGHEDLDAGDASEQENQRKNGDHDIKDTIAYHVSFVEFDPVFVFLGFRESRFQSLRLSLEGGISQGDFPVQLGNTLEG